MAKAPIEIKSLARSHTEAALKTLVGVMNQPDAPPAARVAAANSILDRGYGKPHQELTQEVLHSYVARLPDKAVAGAEWQKQYAPDLTTH